MEMKYDQNKWFSPRYAVNYLWDIFKIKGNSDRNKKEGEAWILGVALFGVMKLFGNKWWLQVPQDDPPDMLAMSIIPNIEKNFNEMHWRDIEIMQITKFTKASIDEEILRKLKNKMYVKETGLLVYLQRTMYIKDMKVLSQNLKKAGVKVSDVWILASTSESSQDYILFSLYPKVLSTTFNLDDEMKNLEPGDLLELEFNSGIKMELTHNITPTKFIP